MKLISLFSCLVLVFFILSSALVNAKTNTVSTNLVINGVTIIMDTNAWLNPPTNSGYWNIIYPFSTNGTKSMPRESRIQDSEHYKSLRLLMRDKKQDISLGYITALLNSSNGLTYDLALKLHQLRIVCLAQMGYINEASNVINIISSNTNLPSPVRNYVKYYNIGIDYINTKKINEVVIQKYLDLSNLEKDARIRRLAQIALADVLVLDNQIDKALLIYKKICDENVSDDISLFAYESWADILDTQTTKKAQTVQTAQTTQKIDYKFVNSLYIKGILLSADKAWFGDVERVYNKIKWKDEINSGKTIKQIYNLIPSNKDSKEFVKMLKNKVYLLGEKD